MRYIDETLFEPTNHLETVMQEKYPEQQKIDVIIIDGMDRASWVEPSMALLKEDGILIIDDSDRYDFEKLLKKYNLFRIDFYGYSPGVILKKCSSIYFRENCKILKQ